MQPLVSVIVPIYNSSRYIEKAIESICKQSYENIEIILVNDGTKDQSIKLALNVINNYDKQYKLHNQDNMGLPGARNSGIQLSSGKYICFIDSDDIIDKGHIIHLVSLIESSNLKVVFSDYEFTDESNRCGNRCENYPTHIYSKDELFRFFVLRKPAIHCCALMVNNNYIKSNNLYFNEKLKYGEDAEYMWRLFSNIESIGRVNSTTYKYLIRENSIMTSIGIEKGLIFLGEFFRSLHSLAEKDEDYKQYYEWAYYRNALGWIHSVAHNADYKIFETCVNSIDINKLSKTLKRYPDAKIKVLVSLIKFNKRLAYKVFKGV